VLRRVGAVHGLSGLRPWPAVRWRWAACASPTRGRGR